MERILHIVGGTMDRNNGIANFLINIYRNLDISKFQFDFVEFSGGDKKGEYDEEIKNRGGKIFYVPSPGRHLLSNMFYTYRILKDEKYKVIHRHTAVSLSWPDFLVARLAGVPIRICHSHGTMNFKPCLHRFFYPLFYCNITHKMACSKAAGEFLFKKKDSFEVQKNGVDSKKFQFNMDARVRYRKQLGVDDETLVLGFVGRLGRQKNPMRIVEIFKGLCSLREKVFLLILGDGELKGDMESLINDMNRNDSVLFLGVVSNVSDWMSAMDVVVFPSLFEGFPVAVVESECSGLKIVMSDTITNEVDILNDIGVCSLEDDDREWTTKILSLYSNTDISKRKECANLVLEAGYDIVNTTKELERFYAAVLDGESY